MTLLLRRKGRLLIVHARAHPVDLLSLLGALMDHHGSRWSARAWVAISSRHLLRRSRSWRDELRVTGLIHVHLRRCDHTLWVHELSGHHHGSPHGAWLRDVRAIVGEAATKLVHPRLATTHELRHAGLVVRHLTG